jgi:glutathione S-transferase
VPRQSQHMARRPFGKAPVLDHDGFRIMEAGAIVPYLNEVLPAPSFTPDCSKDRGRMRMAMGIVDCYGYSALIAVAGYHLFPDFTGGAECRATKPQQRPSLAEICEAWASRPQRLRRISRTPRPSFRRSSTRSVTPSA